MPFDTVLLTGAGACDNSWDTVKRVLSKYFTPINDNTANLAMANLIFQLRWLTINKSHSQKVEDHLKSRLKTVAEIKKLISSELEQDEKSGTIHLGKPLSEIKKLLAGEICFITTNWDLLLENEFGLQRDPKHFIHIHGDRGKPETLYLPSEITQEAYREEPESAYLMANHHNAVAVMEAAKRIVIWGLGFNDLDAELAITMTESIASQRSKNLMPEIHVFDRSPERIRDKLQLFNVDAGKIYLNKVE